MLDRIGLGRRRRSRAGGSSGGDEGEERSSIAIAASSQSSSNSHKLQVADGVALPETIESTAREDEHPTDEASATPRRLSFAHLVEVAPKIVAGSALLGLALYFFAYLYLLGYYEQFDATMEEVGLDKATVLIRAASSLAALALSSIVFASMWILARARWLKGQPSATELFDSTQQWLAWVVGSVATLLFGVLLAVVGLPFAAALCIPACVLLVELARVNPLSEVKRRPSTKSRSTVRRIYLLGVAALSIPVLLALVGPQLAMIQGVEDGNAAIINGPRHREQSAWEFYTGARAQLVILQWIGAGASPLGQAEGYALYLGSSNGIAVFFDFSTCKTVRLPANTVTQEVVSNVQPDGLVIAPPPAPPTCVVV